jgi:signal peptidase I
MFVQKPPPPTPEPLDVSLSVYLSRAFMAFGIVYAFTEYVADITLCEGPSMSPTINSFGDIVLIDKWTLNRRGVHGNSWKGEERLNYNRKEQERYEAIEEQTLTEVQEKKSSTTTTTTKPSDNDIPWYQHFISVSDMPSRLTWSRAYKQFIKSPLSIGDIVVVQNPHRPNGTVCKRVLGLPGDHVLLDKQASLLVVPDGHVWIEGDHPRNSNDSRMYGPVPASLIVGRVVARIWPRPQMFRRGMRPKDNLGGSVVLPAGYEGERIVK